MQLLVALPLIGAAMYLVLLVYTYRVALGAFIEGMARSLPIIGGYIADGLIRVMDWSLNKIKAFTETHVVMLARWILRLAFNIADPLIALSAFVEAVVKAFDIVLHQRVPAFIGKVAGDIQRKVEIAIATANSAASAVTGVDDRIRAAVAGVAGLTDAAVTRGIDRLKIDLGDLYATRLANGIDTLRKDLGIDLKAARDGIDKLRHDVANEASDVATAAEAGLGEFAGEAKRIAGDLPLGQIGAIGLPVAAVAAFAAVLARESGLSKRECRTRVRGICEADPSAWEDLLLGLVGGIALGSFHEIVTGARGILHELSDDVDGYIRSQL